MVVVAVCPETDIPDTVVVVYPEAETVAEYVAAVRPLK